MGTIGDYPLVNGALTLIFGGLLDQQDHPQVMVIHFFFVIQFQLEIDAKHGTQLKSCICKVFLWL